MPRPVVPSFASPRNPVVLTDEVRAGADEQPRGVDAAGLEVVDLGEQHRKVDDHPVADDGRAAGGEDPRGQQVQGVLLVADDDRVAGVVAAVVLDHVVDRRPEQVGRLALALVTPLGAEQHDGRHRDTPTSSGGMTGRDLPCGVRGDAT